MDETEGVIADTGPQSSADVKNDYEKELGDAMAAAMGEPEETEETEEESVEEEDFETEVDEEELEEEIEAPEHWSSDHRERFQALPDEAKKDVLEIRESLEKDYHKKRQRDAAAVRTGESVIEALAPMREVFSQHGMDEAAAVRYMAATYSQLMRNPRETLQTIANQYGIDFSEPQEDDYADPAVSELRKEVKTLKNLLAQNQQASTNTATQAATAQFNAFVNAKDESGQLMHPHVDLLKANMAELIRAGEADSYESAYDLALKRARKVAGVPDKKTSQRELAKKAKAAQKAKAASVGIQGEAGSADKSGKNWKDAIRLAM